MIAKISLYSEIFGHSEIVLLHVLGSNDPVLVFSISTLTAMILFRIDWVFHLFVRLYNPSYKHFVTELSFKSFSITAPVLGLHLLSSLSSFSHFLGCQTHPLRMKTQRMFG